MNFNCNFKTLPITDKFIIGLAIICFPLIPIFLLGGLFWIFFLISSYYSNYMVVYSSEAFQIWQQLLLLEKQRALALQVNNIIFQDIFLKNIKDMYNQIDFFLEQAAFYQIKLNNVKLKIRILEKSFFFVCSVPICSILIMLFVKCVNRKKKHGKNYE